MHFLRTYLFPAIFGLLIYLSIRLVNDSMSTDQFLDRPPSQNILEILFSIALGFSADYLMRRAINNFEQRTKKASVQNVLREFSIISAICLVLFNPVLFLLHYLIRDPVAWNDFIIANILVLLFTLLYYAIARGNSFIRFYIEHQTQLEKLRNDHLQTELKFLRAQYHPHFLFNALNTIYFQMDENVAAAKLTIEKFSELLRYQLYDQQQLVTMKQELEYLQNFIYVQKVRASSQLQLNLNIDPALNSEKVYPLLFLPLVENAFKYAGGTFIINIDISKENNDIVFKVENTVPTVLPQKENGIGLENLQRRLKLLYPGQHFFTITSDSTHFTALLKLPAL